MCAWQAPLTLTSYVTVDKLYNLLESPLSSSVQIKHNLVCEGRSFWVEQVLNGCVLLKVTFLYFLWSLPSHLTNLILIDLFGFLLYPVAVFKYDHKFFDTPFPKVKPNNPPPEDWLD